MKINYAIKAFCLLIAVVLAFTLTSCDAVFGLFDSGNTEKTVFYGVGDHISELNNTCIFLVGVGHVSIPSLTVGDDPEFKSGDLIEITFDTKADELYIMESYPARFGASASEIKVVAANVELKYEDNAYSLVTYIPENLSDIAVGDKLICGSTTCTIEEIDEGRMKLSSDSDMSDLIRDMIHCDMTFSAK